MASDANWFIEHVRALLAEPDVQTPLQLEEFVTTEAQQADLFGGANERGDLFLIAEVEGKRVGELNLRRGTRAAFRHSALLGMSVARARRNQGVGSALIRRAIEWAKAEGLLRRIELYVYVTNAPAIRLYERHGFIVEGKRTDAIRVGDDFVADLIMAHHISLCARDLTWRQGERGTAFFPSTPRLTAWHIVNVKQDNLWAIQFHGSRLRILSRMKPHVCWHFHAPASGKKYPKVCSAE